MSSHTTTPPTSMQGVKYDHLKFYSNSESSSAGGLRLGGVDIMPSLRAAGPVDDEKGGKAKRSAIEKHVEIVEYLKSLPPGSKATGVDIHRVLGIDLTAEMKVLNMLKSNPKLESNFSGDEVSFTFRPKFVILDRQDLLVTIDRTASGIVLNDIIDCYDALESDVMEMIVGGDIIAIKNKELKSLVLYPRGRPFLVELSAPVTARPGEVSVTTAAPLKGEMRRGEAVKIGDYWYRVSTSAKGAGSANRPTSVLLDKDPPAAKNDYLLPFDHRLLPLDGDFEGDLYTGPAYRHGCTTDLGELWMKTAAAMVPFQGKDSELAQKLVSLNLLSTQFMHRPVHAKKTADKAGPKKRAKRMRESQMNSGGFGVNSHLRGTKLARVLQETREQSYRADNGTSGSSKG